MAHVSSRRLKTTRDLLVAGGIFAWALFHTPDSIPAKSGELIPREDGRSSVVPDSTRTLVRSSGKNQTSSVRPQAGGLKELPVSSKSDSSEAISPEVPSITTGIPEPVIPGISAGNADVSRPRSVRNSIIPTAIQQRAEMRGFDVLAAVPRGQAKSPVAFAIPESGVALDALEEEVIHTAQQSFADEMQSAPVNDPASQEYASHWQRAVEAHDDYLRRMLGWDKFNQLSALASQRSYAESGVLK